MKNSEIHIRDPFVLVHGGKYYMYGTRAKNFGQKTGGFDVYIGDDLENWSEPREVFNSDAYGLNRNVNWAPEVHEIGGKFYMFATFTKEDGLRGTYILVSDSPDGSFVPVSEQAATPEDWECLDGTFYEEDGKRYIIFCHEHTQIYNGTVCFSELDNTMHSVGEPQLLFDAGAYLGYEPNEDRHAITDGPFLYRHSCGNLLMFWSTVEERAYRQCIAISKEGKLNGKWDFAENLFDQDGGHGMLFKDLDGKLRFTLHKPNTRDYERPRFFFLTETEDSVTIASEEN